MLEFRKCGVFLQPSKDGVVPVGRKKGEGGCCRPFPGSLVREGDRLSTSPAAGSSVASLQIIHSHHLVCISVALVSQVIPISIIFLFIV